jgi:hypothetical protein
MRIQARVARVRFQKAERFPNRAKSLRSTGIFRQQHKRLSRCRREDQMELRQQDLPLLDIVVGVFTERTQVCQFSLASLFQALHDHLQRFRVPVQPKFVHRH